MAKSLSLGALVVLLMSGCVRVETRDSGPTGAVDVSHIPDAVPRVEARTIAGNKSPYTVLGKSYTVMDSSENYWAEGVASWYGTKFHGQHTANGEIYDMYAMSAAHKTLPIPTYVRVTNLANQRSVIVRVNDRGPFHGDRLIDLSYSAAHKLGFHQQGTARVRVEALDPRNYQSQPSWPSQNTQAGVAAYPIEHAYRPDTSPYQLPDNTFLQVAALSSEAAAQTLQGKLAPLTTYPVVVSSLLQQGKKLYRVRIGPVRNNLDMQELRTLLKDTAVSQPHIVRD